MRSVQREYKTTDYGTKHNKPDTTAERKKLAGKLEEHSLQTYVKGRKLAHKAIPVIDLMHQGSENLDNPKVYPAHIKSTRIIKNLGVPQATADPAHTPISSRSSSIPSSRSSSPDFPTRITTPQRAHPPDQFSQDEESDDSDTESLFGVSREDLELDEEEPYGMMDEIVRKLAEAAGDTEVDEVQEDDDEDAGSGATDNWAEGGSPLASWASPPGDSVGSPVGVGAGDEEMDEFFDAFFD